MEIKLLKDKKGQQFNKTFISVVSVIITVVVLFVLFSNLVPEAQSAGAELGDDAKCAEAGCFVNSTLSPSCVINSSVEGTGVCQNAITNIPLSSLFSSSGLVILLLMVFLLLGIIKLVLPSRKK